MVRWFKPDGSAVREDLSPVKVSLLGFLCLSVFLPAEPTLSLALFVLLPVSLPHVWNLRAEFDSPFLSHLLFFSA